MLRYILTLILYAIALFIAVKVNDQLSYGSGRLETDPVPNEATREIAFVANEIEGSVTLIDVSSWTVLGTMNVLPDGRRVGYLRDILQAFSGQRKAEELGQSYVSDIALSRDGRTLFVGRTNLADIIAFDLATDEPYWRRPVAGFYTGDIVLNEGGDRLFVSAPSVPRIDVVETYDEKLARGLPIEGKLIRLGRSPKSGNILALYSQLEAQYVATYDPTNLEIVGVPVEVKSFDEFRALTGGRPDLCRIDPIAETLVYRDDSVETGTAELDLGASAVSVRVTSDQAYCLIADHQKNEVTILPISSDALSDDKAEPFTLETGRGPGAIEIGYVPESVLVQRFGNLPEIAPEGDPIRPLTESDAQPGEEVTDETPEDDSAPSLENDA